MKTAIVYPEEKRPMIVTERFRKACDGGGVMYCTLGYHAQVHLENNQWATFLKWTMKKPKGWPSQTELKPSTTDLFALAKGLQG